MIAIVAGAVAVVALGVGGVVAFSGGGDSDDEGKGGASPSVTVSATGTTPSPEDSLDFGDPTDEATGTLPDDSASPNLEDLMPTPTNGPRPSYMLQVGDCFNLVKEKDGYADPASCNGSHDAEVVYKTKLEGEFDTDSAIRSKAESLCESKLNQVGERQPSGTVSQTLVQYPSTGGVQLGMRSVTCSLAASSGDKLTKPLA
ncbi:hypothetical protein AB0M28_18150 [Streptomyces sp. NPDC051940]|uniref:hypothetical protein n=1 Tax=Streptomyces sp. NPDC051940 TaxID=3155675 RepID=UPI0034256F29